MNAKWVGVFIGSVACASCGMHPAGPMQHDTSNIERDKSERVHVTLDMGGGDFKVDSGTDKLVSADFNYNVPDWKPEVQFTSSGGKGELSIRQPNSHHVNMGGNQTNNWDVRLNKDVPMDMTIHIGAGDANLKLGDLTLRGLDLEMGAGDLDVDLRGSPKMSYDVRMRGGVGDATVHLPGGVGIDATATGGIGDIEAPGLHVDGHHYTNDALGKSNVTIHLDITGGVGSIKLIGS